MEADMLRGILFVGAAALLLSAPALAIGPASMPAPGPATTASQCDGCSSQDQDDTSGGSAGQQSQTTPAGSGVTGPVSNPSTPQPAHTEVPSHASGAGPGGSPKG
jgi:hypothetical protein